MITLERVLNSWNKLNSNQKKQLEEDYRLNIWETKKGDFYFIESSTNSGFVVGKNTVELFLSGVTVSQYYNDLNIEITRKVDVKRLFSTLVRKERINKDRLSNVVIFLEDVATRDKVGSLDELANK